MKKKPLTNNGKNNPNTNFFEFLNYLTESEQVENPHKETKKYHSNNKATQQPQEHLIPTNKSEG
jgi:hypothetical protein